MHGISPCEIKGGSCSEFLSSISKLWEIQTYLQNYHQCHCMLLYKVYTGNCLLATSHQNVINQATFRDESSSVSNNIKFQIFQNRFHNVQSFSINQIKYFNVYADSCKHGHNILRLFDVWPNFPSTSSETKPDY